LLMGRNGYRCCAAQTTAGSASCLGCGLQGLSRLYGRELQPIAVDCSFWQALPRVCCRFARTSDNVAGKTGDSFPRSAWECLPGRSAALCRDRMTWSVEHGIRTQSVGTSFSAMFRPGAKHDAPFPCYSFKLHGHVDLASPRGAMHSGAARRTETRSRNQALRGHECRLSRSESRPSREVTCVPILRPSWLRSPMKRSVR